jgi:putative flavoprotein involved in K+ transport
VGSERPPASRDDADAPVVLRPPRALDLAAEDINSVVWCTGYRGDFSWLDPELTDAGGQPRRTGAASTAPGVWYVGLRWLTAAAPATSSAFRSTPRRSPTLSPHI